MQPGKDPNHIPGGFLRFLAPVLVVTALLIGFLWMANLTSSTVELSNSEFEALVKEGAVSKLLVRGNRIEGELGGGQVRTTDDGRKYSKFTTMVDPESWAQQYRPMIQQAEKDKLIQSYDWKPQSRMPEILLNIALFGGLLLLIWFFFFRRIAGGAGGVSLFGKSKAQLIPKGQIKATFDDIAGIDEAKEEVQEIIYFLREPERIRKLGGRIPHGVLLIGPPGTGKTLLAKAIAGEADVPFFSISGSDFVELFVGVGASRVRDLFSQAKASAPCIIFLDEIDAVGRKRGPAHSSGGIEEREQTLNAILVEMQGLTSNENVIVIAATNRPDMLDPALLRPGRFDRRVFVDLPDVKGREEILRIHVRKNEIKLSPDVELPVIARGTPSFSGAELENLLNESALIAVRREKDSVEMADIEEARDKVRWGRELKSRTVPVVDKRRTAYHEAGHALVTTLLTDVDPLHKVSIIPRGRAMGATLMLPKSDEFMLSRNKILQIITSLLAGRTAEKLMLGDISTGAQNDIERTTELARRMVCEWGMSDRLGPVNFTSESLVPGFEELGRTTNYSDRTAEIIDEEVNRIVTECQDRCTNLIQDNRETLVAIAEKLIEKETLSAEDVGAIIESESLRRGLEVPPMNIHLRQKSEQETQLPTDPLKA